MSNSNKAPMAHNTISSPSQAEIKRMDKAAQARSAGAAAIQSFTNGEVRRISTSGEVEILRGPFSTIHAAPKSSEEPAPIPQTESSPAIGDAVVASPEPPTNPQSVGSIALTTAIMKT